MSCLTCRHLERIDHAAGAARCMHGGRLAIHAGWRHGCAFWSRRDGAPDSREPSPPLAAHWLKPDLPRP